jgi:amidase
MTARMTHSTARDRVFPLAPKYDGDPILSLTALEQAARIADGTLRSADLVDRYLARIREHDGAINACVAVMERDARREAERADRLRARGRIIGPFHGVPTAIKDHHMVRFTRTRIGSRAFDWLWTPTDDDFVQRVRAAGFVIIAKTTMSELGILPIVETELQPPTRNPWNLSRTAGGSSGGAGAAIAAGMVPIAPGSDGAGSVRIPSALHGLVGLKPTRGLIPDRANKIDVYGLASNGPMARSIDDAAALLDVLCETGKGSHLARSRDPVRPLRVGVFVDPPVGVVDPRIVARVELAAERLRAAGHTVERRATPDGTLDDFMPVYQRFVSRIPVLNPSRLGPFARWFWESGHKVPESMAQSLMRRFEASGRQAMKGLDVLLSPTVGVQAFEVGQFAALEPEAQFRALAPLGAFTAIANVTGQPALSVPFGLVDGMPVGVQLIGAHGQDAALFALARSLVAGSES